MMTMVDRDTMFVIFLLERSPVFTGLRSFFFFFASEGERAVLDGDDLGLDLGFHAAGLQHVD